MKNIMKKVIAVFAVLCVAMTSMASCAGKPESSNSTSNSGSSAPDATIDKEALKRYPLNIGAAGDGNVFAGEDEFDLDGDDPVAVTTSANTEKSTTPQAPVTIVREVTDANNQPVTKVVEVTEANGEKRTDANNQPVTEIVRVTEVVTTPVEETTSDSSETPTGSSETPVDSTVNSDYKPKNDGRYAMWIDCSKNENFMFEGEMLKATFKVKEGIPDGDYRIRISPDLSDVTGTTVNPSKVIDGTIRVNNGEIEAVDVSNENGALVFYGDNIACKQGDTIDFNINIKNNTGLVAFCIWFYFDGNALEFVEACATGEYEEIARQTEIGRGKNNQ